MSTPSDSTPSASAGPAPARAPATAAATNHYVRRKRALAACQFCRLRKTKCDNARPVCGSCRHHQARCVYADGSEADGLDEAAGRHREVLERLDDIRDLLARPPASGAGSPVSVLSTLAGNGREGEGDGEGAGVGGAVGMDGVFGGQHASSSTAYLQYTKCEAVLKWPVLSGVMTDEDAAIDSFIFDSHVRGDGEEVEAAPSPSINPASPSLHRGADQKPRATPLPGQGLPEKDLAALCRKFLALVNCRNPILDASDLLSYAKSVAKDGLAWDGKSCIVLLACALASYSRAWAPPPSTESSPSPSARRESTVPPEVMSESDDEAAEAYYEAAQKRFGFLGMSLVDIQCFYYASLHERFAFRPLQAWMYLQQAATRLRVHHMERNVGGRRPHASGQDDQRAESRLSAVSYQFEQRAFWSIHKTEKVFSTELGFTLASDLADCKYPSAFPTPPESLNHLPPGADDDDDLSDVLSARHNEFIWFYYLAEISLRRILDDVLSVIYEKGERSWVDNIDLVLRQYYESEKQISDWQSHLPPTMRYNPASQPNNEMGYYLESRFEEWGECILRPLAYYCLHHPSSRPPPPPVAALAQRHMALCETCILRCASYDRHGGTWMVLRRAFRAAMVMLAAVVAGGPLRPPANWRALAGTAVRTIARWAVGVRDLQRMGRVLERVLRAVCEVEDGRMEVEGEEVG